MNFNIFPKETSSYKSEFDSDKLIEILKENTLNGILNIATKDLKKITLLDCTGKFVEELAPNSQIDLGYLAKGIYIMKFLLEKEIIVEKVVIQ